MIEELLALPDDRAAETGARLRLRRAWPRADGHLIIEYRRGDGALVPGQWFADEDRAVRVAKQTARSAPGTDRWLVPAAAGCVVLQPGGADRRLRPLPDIVARPDTTLLAHRPERRAVARRDGGARCQFVKVVRPSRVRSVVDPLRRLAAEPGRPFAVPTIAAADEARGVVVMDALPGAPLHEEAGAAGHEAFRAIGRALRWLHERAPGDAAAHGPDEEIGLVRDCIEQLRPYAPDVAAAAAAAAGAVADGLAGAPGPTALLHRDFYDKQVLIDDAGGIGLLDFETFAAGEAALDVANLLAHLELRALQDRAGEATVVDQGAAFLAGYAPDAAVRRRVAPYLDATRVRLACLYALRPRWAPLTDALLARAGAPTAVGALVAS